jgi:hypothetical protein
MRFRRFGRTNYQLAEIKNDLASLNMMAYQLLTGKKAPDYTPAWTPNGTETANKSETEITDLSQLAGAFKSFGVPV